MRTATVTEFRNHIKEYFDAIETKDLSVIKLIHYCVLSNSILLEILQGGYSLQKAEPG
jgi:hypothetical protein